MFGLRKYPDMTLIASVSDLDRLTPSGCDGKLKDLPNSVVEATKFADQYLLAHAGGKTKLQRDHVAALNFRALLV